MICNSTMKKTILMSGCVVVLVAAATAAYCLFAYDSTQLSPGQVRRQQVDQDLQAGRRLLDTSSAQSAIPWLQQAASQAIDLDQMARAELNLGNAYRLAGMPQQGIALLKLVSLNIAYPSGYRSTAAQDAMQYYISGKDSTFAVQNIFTGATWGDFLQGPPTATNLNLAIKNCLLWVLSIDTSLSSFSVNYRLANWYAEDALGQTGNAQAHQDVVWAEHYLQLGDGMYPDVLAANAAALQQTPDTVPPFTQSVVGNALILKARALGDLYLIEANNVTFDAVMQAFKQALALLDGNRPSSSSTVLFSYFHFAEFLVKADPAANAEQISSALSHLYANPALYQTNSFFQGFLKQYGTNPIYRGNATWKDIVALAKVDSRFKAALMSVGWSSAEFQ